VDLWPALAGAVVAAASELGRSAWVGEAGARS
jgi:hypothetical protein